VSARAWLPRPRPLPPRRPSGVPGGEAGFSIIELMVALILLGLGILSVANLFPLGSRTQMRDRMRSSASSLAEQKMEQLRMLAWSATDLNAGTHPVGGETLNLADEGRFRRWYVVEAQTGDFADMKKVTVRVTWTAQVPDTVELLTYFRR
jgi:type IV pilus assembly protein PilV